MPFTTHNTQHTTHDIRQIHAEDLGITDTDKYTYIMTYSFPCTDLSVAGKMQGMSKAEWENGNATRSGLLWEVERILKGLPKEQLPQVLLMENVPQVHADQNRSDWDNWLSFLKSRGYINHWKDLNAKNYGIPQNRERCFCVSILSDTFVDFEWPEEIPLTTVMRDYLEDQVDEKYYINSEKADKLIAELIERGELQTEQNRTEQNRTEQNRTEQNRTEQRAEADSLCQEHDRQKRKSKCGQTRHSHNTDEQRLQRVRYRF